jgi:hypothetical protein
MEPRRAIPATTDARTSLKDTDKSLTEESKREEDHATGSARRKEISKSDRNEANGHKVYALEVGPMLLFVENTSAIVYQHLECTNNAREDQGTETDKGNKEGDLEHKMPAGYPHVLIHLPGRVSDVRVKNDRYARVSELYGSAFPPTNAARAGGRQCRIVYMRRLWWPMVEIRADSQKLGKGRRTRTRILRRRRTPVDYA